MNAGAPSDYVVDAGRTLLQRVRRRDDTNQVCEGHSVSAVTFLFAHDLMPPKCSWPVALRVGSQRCLMCWKLLVLHALVIASVPIGVVAQQPGGAQTIAVLTHDSTEVRVGAAQTAALRFEISDDKSDSSTAHHAVRNGALVGAAIGFAAGLYAGTYYHVTCSGECSTTRERTSLVLLTGAEGAAAFALLGATVSKLWSALHR